MKKISIPIVVEAGSQPPDEDGAVLDYMEMPSGVSTYSMPSVPEPEEIQGLDDGIAMLSDIHAGLQTYVAGSRSLTYSLDDLDAANRDLVNQVLGAGEVSIRYEGELEANVQESVLAGVWRVQYADQSGVLQRDTVEVADIPTLVKRATFEHAVSELSLCAEDIPPSVGNAAALLSEISDKLEAAGSGVEAHVINLTLLPVSDDDVEFLAESLGGGPVVILSRGYGNCRITSTATRCVWWVQYFNSQDALILNSIEISQVPEVACAAQEDIEDSAARLSEILEVYQ